MKMTFLSIGALAVLFLATACESNTVKSSDRLGGNGGVTVASQDMSRIAPTRTVPGS